MKNISIITILLLFSFYLPLQADEYQKILNQLRIDKGFPGANLCILLPEELMIQRSTGYADPDTGEKMTTRARMFSGSVGKTYVSAVALQLVSEGKLHLDDKIINYLGGEDWFSRLANSKVVTVRMLMNHTSGIREHVLDPGFTKSVLKKPDRIWKPVELIRFILDKKPLFPAGAGWAYADTNYIILGMILEKILGHSYYTALQTRILKPFKLNDTWPAVGRQLRGLTQGYTGERPFFFPEKVVKDGHYIVDPQFEWTGGGLITTATDLAKWAKALYSGRVLTPEMRKELLQARDMTTGKRSSQGYGLGVEIWDTPHGFAYGHGGIFPGYQSVMKYYPKYNFSIALQVNEDRTHNAKLKDVYHFVDKFVPLIVSRLTK